MFDIIRVILMAVVICAGLFLKIRMPNYQYRWTFISLVAFVLVLLSGLTPVENVFVTFSSPQSAYNYMYMDKAKLVVEGTSTAFVAGGEKEDSPYIIIPRSDTGWKLAVGLDMKTIIQKMTGEVTYCVYQYKHSEEYYITIHDFNGAKSDVTDSCNSKFYRLGKYNKWIDETFYIYYAYVHNLDDKYTLTVNGKTYSVMDEES